MLTIQKAKVDSTTRSSSGLGESRSATLKYDVPNPQPPPATIEDAITFEGLSEGYYEDFRAAMVGGLEVDVTYDETATPPSVVGVTMRAP